MLSVQFLPRSRHEIYKRFSSGDLISGLNRKVSVRSRDPREDAGNPREKEGHGGREEGKEERERCRSIKSAEWIRPQCRRKEESPSLESASERKLKNAEERNKRTLSPKEDAELWSERDEIAAEKEDDDRDGRKSRAGKTEEREKERER